MIKTYQFIVNSGSGRGQQTIRVAAVSFDEAWRKVRYTLSEAEWVNIRTVTQTIV